MPEPVTREEHQHVEQRLSKQEAQLSSLMNAVKSNADSIGRIEQTIERSNTILFSKIDGINARTQMSPGTAIAIGTFGIVVLGGLLTFMSVVIRPIHYDVQRHEGHLYQILERRESDAYNNGVRDEKINTLEQRTKQ